MIRDTTVYTQIELTETRVVKVGLLPEVLRKQNQRGNPLEKIHKLQQNVSINLAKRLQNIQALEMVIGNIWNNMRPHTVDQLEVQ